jgi:glycosyltransferase involved in cell wall biosynthesis
VKLSIVVPSFNQAAFLPETLASLFGQQGVREGELEIIVVDGGSRDGSVEILRRHAGRFAHWVSEPDRGQTHALIKGFAAATGDVFGWLCSDDLLEPNTVREVLDCFSQQQAADFVYGDGVWIDRQSRVIGPKKEIPYSKFVWMFDHNYIPQPSAFWRRRLHEKAGGLDEEFQLAMDGDLWARFAEVTRPRHVRRMWSRMRRYPEQKNQRLRARSDFEDAIIRRRAVAWPDSGLPLSVARAAAKAMRVTCKLATGCYWGAGGADLMAPQTIERPEGAPVLASAASASADSGPVPAGRPKTMATSA